MDVNDEVAFICIAGIVSDGWSYQALPGFVASHRPDAWTALQSSPWRLRLTDGEKTLGHAPLGFQPFRGCGPRGSGGDGLVFGVLRFDRRIRGIEVVGEAGVVHQYQRREEPPLIENVRAVIDNKGLQVTWGERAEDTWVQVRLEPNCDPPSAALPSPLHWIQTERVSLPLSDLPRGCEVRARVWISDGLDSATALSPPVFLPHGGSRVAILSKPRGEVPFGRPISIGTHGTHLGSPNLPDEFQWVLDGRALGDRRMNLTLREIPPGSHHLELRTEAEVLSSFTFTVAEPTEDQRSAESAWRRHDARIASRRPC